MGKDGSIGLGMAKGVCRDGDLRHISEFSLEPMQSHLEVIDDLVVVGSCLVMLHKAPTENLPKSCLQNLLQCLSLVIVNSRSVPMFKESHFTVHEASMSPLVNIPVFLSPLLALVQHPQRSVEYLLDTIEVVLGEVGFDSPVARTWIVVVVKGKDPEGVKMGMYCHVKCVGINVRT